MKRCILLLTVLIAFGTLSAASDANFSKPVDIGTDGDSAPLSLSGTGGHTRVVVDAAHPFLENFDTCTIRDLPPGWTKILPPNYDTSWTTAVEFPAFGFPLSAPNFACIQYSQQAQLNHWMISPPLELSANVQYRIDFYYRARNSGLSENLELKCGTAPNAASLSTTLMNHAGFTNLGYQLSRSYFTPAASGTYYFGWHAYSSAFSHGINIDDISIMPTPSTPFLEFSPMVPDFDACYVGTHTDYQNVKITNKGTGTLIVNSADVSLAGAAADQFYIDRSVFPFALEADLSANILVRFVPTTAGNHVATLKIVNNQYRAEYNATLKGHAVSESRLLESFERSSFPPPGWANPGSWRKDDSYSKHGDFSACLDSDFDHHILSTPKLSIGPGDVLTFWSLTGTRHPIQILRSTDRITWEQVGPNIQQDNYYTWQKNTVDLSSAAGNYYLGIANGDYSTINIDLVIGPTVISMQAGTPSLVSPENGVVNQSLKPTLNWDEPTDGGAIIRYHIYLDTNPNPSTLFDTSPTNTYSVETPLDWNTTYYWKVVAVSRAGEGAASQIWSFTTEMQVPAPAPPMLTFPAPGATNLPRAGFNLSWEPDLANGGPPIRYEVYMSQNPDILIGSDIVFKTTQTSLNPTTYVEPNSSAPVTFEFLDQYYWTVKAIGNGSATATARYFVIEDAYSEALPYSQDFEEHADESLPPEWSRSSNGFGWHVSTILSSDRFVIPPHTVYAAANDDWWGSWNDGSVDFLNMPRLNIQVDNPNAFICLSFDSFFNGYFDQAAKVEASIDNDTWELVYLVPPFDGWIHHRVNLSDYSGNNYLYIRFHADDQGNRASGWAIDNVLVDINYVDDTPPQIYTLPILCTPNQSSSHYLECTVTDLSPVENVTACYSYDGGSVMSLPLAEKDNQPGVWFGTIPAGQALGQIISYQIKATDAFGNVGQTEEFVFETDNPVWVYYDYGEDYTFEMPPHDYDWLTWGALNIFANPFFEEDDLPLYLYKVSVASQNPHTDIQLQVYLSDEEDVQWRFNLYNPFFGTPLSVSLSGQNGSDNYVWDTFDLTNFNNGNPIEITDPYFAIAFENLPNTNSQILFDESYDYGMCRITKSDYYGDYIYRLTSNSGSWAISAEIGAALGEQLLAPQISLSLIDDAPVIQWNDVSGAQYYKIYGSSDPTSAKPWIPVAVSVPGLSYIYTGTEGHKFFYVTASGESAKRRLNRERRLPLLRK